LIATRQLYNYMDKIQKSLKDQCLVDLQKPFKIIVTGAIAPEEAMRMGLNTIAGLDNIYSGSVLGETILTIAQHEAIDSIELDNEMSIL
jgi:hypothetical protein